jgi:hypothetical protein
VHLLLPPRPSHPRLRGHPDLDPTAREEIGGLTATGQFVYLQVRQTVHVVDVRDPDHPQPVATLPLAWLGDTPLIVDGGLGYVLASEPGGVTSLQVVDLQDPANPRLKGRLPVPDASHLAVMGRHAFVLSQAVHRGDGSPAGISCTAELWLIDVSDPLRPQRIGSWGPVSGCGHTVTVADGYAYLAGRIIDVANPAQPREAGTYEPGEQAMHAAGDLVYAAYGEGGLHILRRVRLSEM